MKQFLGHCLQQQHGVWLSSLQIDKLTAKKEATAAQGVQDKVKQFFGKFWFSLGENFIFPKLFLK